MCMCMYMYMWVDMEPALRSEAAPLFGCTTYYLLPTTLLVYYFTSLLLYYLLGGGAALWLRADLRQGACALPPGLRAGVGRRRRVRLRLLVHEFDAFRRARPPRPVACCVRVIRLARATRLRARDPGRLRPVSESHKPTIGEARAFWGLGVTAWP